MDKLVSASNVTVTNSSILPASPDRDPDHHHQRLLDLEAAGPILLAVLCVLGSACNLTAVAVLLSNARKSKLSLINSLVLNLTLADGLLLTFAVPLRAIALSESGGGGGWTLGWSVCKTADWFLHSCMAAKSFTVAALAKGCYRYVSNPTKQASVRPGSVLAVLLFVWLSACAAPLPHWLFAQLREKESGGGPLLACVQVVPPGARMFMGVYVKAYPLCVFCAPLGVSLLYFWKAYGWGQRRGSKTQNLRTQIRSRRLTLTVFSLTVAMAVLWLPTWVVWVWERQAVERGGGGDGKEGRGGGGGGREPAVSSPPPPLLSLSAQLLAFSLSLVNPLVVLSLSEEFREGYWRLWRRLTLHKHPTARPRPKPGPHTPTAPSSPLPRPETSLRGGDGGGGMRFGSRGGCRVEVRSAKPLQAGDSVEAEDRDGVVLPDVEQFWNERETGETTEEDDPVPWEHQEGKER